MNKKVCFYITLFFCLIFNLVVDFNINNYFNILNICFEQHIILSTKLFIFICIIFCLISIFILIDILLVVYNNKIENKGLKIKKDDATHGTANWMNEKEITNVLGINNEPGIILGKYNNSTIKLPFESYFNKNICVFGSSGSMKTTSFLLTNLLELSLYKKSIIVTDPKGEIYRKTSKYFKNIGYTVKVLNLNDMKHSDRWNPLLENEDINDVQTSANVIISNTQRHNSGSDEFWPRAEENLLKAFMFHYLENLSAENNLTNVYKNIANGDLNEIDNLFKKISPDNPARMSYNIFASGSDTIKASVITGLGTRLQMFQNEDLQKLTAESDIDLTLPAKQPCIYYIITSDMNSAYDFIASLFYTFLFTKLVKYADSTATGKCDNEVYCFLDEFANIGQIPDFNKKISTVRSRGIALIPILQNVGQLKNRYPNDVWQEIIGNCDVRISMGTTDVLTAKYFCDATGVSTVETTSLRKSASLEGSIEEYGQQNISTQKRNLLNIDEILRIPSTQLLVLLRGNKPLLLDKLIYKEHNISKKLDDTSIQEYIPNWNKNISIETKVLKNYIENKEKDNSQNSFDNF